MESVKSIVKDVVYGKSKIHTNMEFTFSNNNKEIFTEFKLDFYVVISYHILEDRNPTSANEPPERLLWGFFQILGGWLRRRNLNFPQS